MTENGVKRIKSSPYHLASNGEKPRDFHRPLSTLWKQQNWSYLTFHTMFQKKKKRTAVQTVQNNCVFATVATSKCTPGPPYGTPLVAAVVAAPIQNEWPVYVPLLISVLFTCCPLRESTNKADHTKIWKPVREHQLVQHWNPTHTPNQDERKQISDTETK